MTDDSTTAQPQLPKPKLDLTSLDKLVGTLNDTDAIYQRALKAGAAWWMEPADQFHRDRMAGGRDPFGNVWWIVTHIEDVPPKDLQRRADTFVNG